jgi:formyl-CoA transferase
MTVIEIANYVSGPFAAMLLADLGATVIKVEGPEGDPFRGWGQVDYSATFGSLNRNKKSVVLNLKDERDAGTLRRLIERADVLIENFRPGTMERLGLGYDDVRSSNERLIYCSITGFGASGPYRDFPGYDTVGQGMSGLLSLLTEMQAPQPMGISLSDHLAGMFASYGVLAALTARQRTGRGQRVETSLLESSIAFLAENAATYFEGGGPPPTRATRTHHALVFAFVGRDEPPFVVHLTTPAKFWRGLLEAIRRPGLADDPRFATRPARIANYDALEAILAGAFRGMTRDDALAVLRENDVPCGPLNDFGEVFADPQVRFLHMERTLPHPTRGSVRVVGSAVRLSETPTAISTAAPELGAHNGDIERLTMASPTPANILPHRIIGMIGPTPDAPFIYYQFYRVFPPGGLLIHSSLNLSGFSDAGVEDALASVWRSLDFLRSFNVDQILLAGVPLSAIAGRPRMLELLDEARRRAGIPVSTDFEEAIAGAHRLGLKRVAIAAKWSPELMRQTATYVEHAGLEVVGTCGDGQTLQQLHALNMQASLAVARDVGTRALRDAPQAQGLLLLGGHWLVMQAVIELEAAFGKPVISNPAAIYWAGLRDGGLRCAAPGMGMLMESLG